MVVIHREEREWRVFYLSRSTLSGQCYSIDTLIIVWRLKKMDI